MTRFLSDILLPFPNSNDLNSHDGANDNLNKKNDNTSRHKLQTLLTVNQESKDSKKHIVLNKI